MAGAESSDAGTVISLGFFEGAFHNNNRSIVG